MSSGDDVVHLLLEVRHVHLDLLRSCVAGRNGFGLLRRAGARVTRRVALWEARHADAEVVPVL